jgi:hypothetical protein
VNEEAPLASFEFPRGALAGSHLSLFASGLVHRSADHFESIPLDNIGSIGVGFERDSGRIAWGCVLVLIAAVLLLAFFSLRPLVASAVAEASTQAQGGSFLSAALRMLDLCVAVLPAASVAAALWGAALLTLGWIGETVLRVAIAPSERVFATRGRDPVLYEFAESVAARIAKRG